MKADSGMRKRIAKILRNWAYRLDPPAKPGRKRKEPKIQAPLLHGWAEEPDAIPHDGISGAGLQR